MAVDTAVAGSKVGTVLNARENLVDVAYRQLEEAIVTLQLSPGLVVSEPALCELTGIGRTPLREAIQRLAREHLIIVMPQRGLLIAHIDVSKQLRLVETRRELDRLVCQLAARRASDAEREQFLRLSEVFLDAAEHNDGIRFLHADQEFNELCMVTARNEFAESALRSLNGLSRRFWYMHYKQAADLPVIARLHADVACAIASKDAAKAAQASGLLIDNIEQFTRSTVLLDTL